MLMTATLQPIVLSDPKLGLEVGEVGDKFIRSTEKIKPSLASYIPYKPFGTTVVVPTSGVISGISPDVGEHSVLPQMENQVAAGILVAMQPGSKSMKGTSFYLHSVGASFHQRKKPRTNEKSECLIQECS